MEYKDAMEKTVSGFKEIHERRRVELKESEEEWNKVYTDFMNKHGLPLSDIAADVSKGTSQISQMENKSNSELQTFIDNLKKKRDQGSKQAFDKNKGTDEDEFDETLDGMTPQSLRDTMENFKKDSEEARQTFAQNKAALRLVMSREEFFLKKKTEQVTKFDVKDV